MSSTINGILAKASSALSAHQKALQVAAHNIANANTDGYSRQRIELSAGSLFGASVRVDDVRRVRDSLLDGTFRRENSSAAAYELRHDTLSRIETVFNEPTDFSLGQVLSNFWSSWSDLAINPADPSTRIIVRERGNQVAQEFNRIARGLDEIQQSLEVRLQDSVEEFNRLSSEIAELNGRIITAAAGGKDVPDLRDAQDRLIDQLSRLTPVQVQEQENGTMRVLLGGMSVVEGQRSFDLATEYSNGEWRVVREETGFELTDLDGTIGSAMELLNRDISSIRQEMDHLARTLVEAVNAVHRRGTNVLGDQDQDFFHADYLTASSIQLSDEVANSADAIAAGLGDPVTGAYRSGADEIALELAQFRHAPQAALGGHRSFGDKYAEIVTGIGFDVNSAEDLAAIHDTLKLYAENRRSSVSGVSIDEEMVSIIQTQVAYSAAARVITAADEMMRTILNL